MISGGEIPSSTAPLPWKKKGKTDVSNHSRVKFTLTSNDWSTAAGMKRAMNRSLLSIL